METATILAEATELKNQGNKAYAEKDYRAAMKFYHRCLLKARCLVQLPAPEIAAANTGSSPSPGDKRKSESEPGSSAEPMEAESAAAKAKEEEEADPQKKEAAALLVTCYNNLAACLLAGEDRRPETLLRAVDYTEKVLGKEPANEKALFRKAKALHLAGELEKAVKAYEACSASNADAQKGKKAAREEDESKRRAAKAEIAANFAKAQAKKAAADEAAAPAAADPASPVPNGHVPTDAGEEA